MTFLTVWAAKEMSSHVMVVENRFRPSSRGDWIELLKTFKNFLQNTGKC